MASCGRTVNRSLILVFLVLSLALAIVAVFTPFCKLSESAAALALSSTNPDNNNSAIPLGVKSASMTIWQVTFEKLDSESDSEKIELRSAYYQCKKGKTNIQVAEGFAVVTCVLCCANIILSIFTFFFSPVVRVPLAVYALLSAGSACVTFGFLVNGYLQSWCAQTVFREKGSTGNTFSYSTSISLKDDGWKITAPSVPLFAVSAVLSLAVCVMAAVGG